MRTASGRLAASVTPGIYLAVGPRCALAIANPRCPDSRSASLVEADFFQQRDEARLGANRVEDLIDLEPQVPL